ncbi:MAG: efflux RND transporter periplasmic adaptor subunit [Acidobacteriota bacterium]
MKKIAYAFLLLSFIAGFFMGGAWTRQRKTGGTEAGPGGRRILHYVDPMNPSHTSDRPGTAPCGMALEPVYEDEEPAAKSAKAPQAAPMPTGTVKIAPRKQQLMGVQVGTVEMTSEIFKIRTLGRATPDENRIYRILAGDGGWIWDIHDSTTGSLVDEDQLMGTLYNYQFIARQQQYLYALDLVDRQRQQQPGAPAPASVEPASEPPGEQAGADSGEPSGDVPGDGPLAEPPAVHGIQCANGSMGTLPVGGQQQVPERFVVPMDAFDMSETPGGVIPTGGVFYFNNPLELSKLELYNLGVGDHQLREIAKTRQMEKNLEIRSPVRGIVISRNVSPRQRFEKGGELFRVANIDRIWVMADVYWREAEYIKCGGRARVTLPGRDTAFEATVSDVPSQFDPVTRVLKVRLDVENPDIVLRPDMFVDVEFLVTMPPALTVPADAVINSGMKRTVFVDLGEGYFEPREVRTGYHFGDRVQVVEGLEPGERIVVAGNFLLDSESKMKLAAAGLSGATARDPVCGKEVSVAKAKAAGLALGSGEDARYFCSAECRQTYAKDHGTDGPSQAAPAIKPSGEPPKQAGARRIERIQSCPVCGMIVIVERAIAEGRSSRFMDKDYHLCSDGCKKRFDAGPARYASPEKSGGSPDVRRTGMTSMHEGAGHD